MPESPPVGAAVGRSPNALEPYTRRALLVFGLFAGTIMWLMATPNAGAIKVGQSLGEVHVELPDGSLWKLEDHRDQVVVLNFWATWCGPCQMEAPVLTRLHRDGVMVMGLATDAMSVTAVAARGHALGFDYPIGKGVPGLLERLDIRTIPTNAVIGRDGKVAFAQSGVVSESVIREAVAEARRR
jgi:thiol-disulfide isomerase/thioredoxin